MLITSIIIILLLITLIWFDFKKGHNYWLAVLDELISGDMCGRDREGDDGGKHFVLHREILEWFYIAC